MCLVLSHEKFHMKSTYKVRITFHICSEKVLKETSSCGLYLPFHKPVTHPSQLHSLDSAFLPADGCVSSSSLYPPESFCCLFLLEIFGFVSVAADVFYNRDAIVAPRYLEHTDHILFKR